MNQRKVEKKKKKNNNSFIKLVIILLVLMLIIFILFQFSKVKIIEVDGNQRYSDQEVLDMLDINIDENIFDIFLNNYEGQKKFPYIREVDIQYTGPNRIKVFVVEKDIVGYIPYMNKYLCIDYEGYIIDYTDSIKPNIPIVEGIAIDDFTINDKLDVGHKVLEVFVMFYHINESYNISIDYIELENNAIDNIVLKLDEIEVYFGSTEKSEYKIIILNEILNQLESGSSGTIDLSGDLSQVIFKKSMDIVN